jgi:hypothetical protein
VNVLKTNNGTEMKHKTYRYGFAMDLNGGVMIAKKNTTVIIFASPIPPNNLLINPRNK